MIMTRWNVISLCSLLIIAGAVVQKGHELSGLRAKARQLASSPAVAEEIAPALTSKPHGERPEQAEDDESRKEKAQRLERMTIFQDYTDLTKAAIDELKLSPEEAAALSGGVQRFRVRASQDLADRLKPKPLLSEGETVNQRYYARARRDRGQAWLDSLTLEIGSIVGQDRSRSLMKNFTNQDLLADLCKSDLDLEVIPPTGEVKETMVKYQIRRPMDGSFSLSAGSTLAEFEAQFGKLFDDDESAE